LHEVVGCACDRVGLHLPCGHVIVRVLTRAEATRGNCLSQHGLWKRVPITHGMRAVCLSQARRYGTRETNERKKRKVKVSRAHAGCLRELNQRGHAVCTQHLSSTMRTCREAKWTHQQSPTTTDSGRLPRSLLAWAGCEESDSRNPTRRSKKRKSVRKI
jgi:hypothetical protein